MRERHLAPDWTRKNVVLCGGLDAFLEATTHGRLLQIQTEWRLIPTSCRRLQHLDLDQLLRRGDCLKLTGSFRQSNFVCRTFGSLRYLAEKSHFVLFSFSPYSTARLQLLNLSLFCLRFSLFTIFDDSQLFFVFVLCESSYRKFPALHPKRSLITFHAHL